jgi:hypothetical protein
MITSFRKLKTAHLRRDAERDGLRKKSRTKGLLVPPLFGGLNAEHADGAVRNDTAAHPSRWILGYE